MVLAEFREFITRGSVIDLAVGVIIGAAFGTIVASLVADIIMPVVSLLVGNMDFSSLFYVLGENPNQLASIGELKKAGIAVIAYGNFILALVNFLILAWVIFLMIKLVNKYRKSGEETDAAPEEVLLLREIRDSLKK